jgi:hypothetical protein
MMLPQITMNRRNERVGFYVNLSKLSCGSLTINVQSNYHSTYFVIINTKVEIRLNIDRRYLECVGYLWQHEYGHGP